MKEPHSWSPPHRLLLCRDKYRHTGKDHYPTIHCTSLTVLLVFFLCDHKWNGKGVSPSGYHQFPAEWWAPTVVILWFDPFRGHASSPVHGRSFSAQIRLSTSECVRFRISVADSRSVFMYWIGEIVSARESITDVKSNSRKPARITVYKWSTKQALWIVSDCYSDFY